MYRAHFHLKASPFQNTPDPDFLFESRSHKEALATMAYGVLEGKGFVLVTGDVGSGKTLLTQALKRELGEKHVVVEILNPWISAEEVLAAVQSAVGVENTESANRWDILKQRLTEIASEGRQVVLVFDEAHQLSERTLIGTCLLSNIENALQKLIQIVLIGQPELDAKLGKYSLRQLQQRISLRAHLEKLTENETADYIRHRVVVAGGSSSLFPQECIDLIYREANGIPRLINLLCEKCLLFACGSGGERVTLASTQDAIKSQRIGFVPQSWPEQGPPETAQSSTQTSSSPSSQKTRTDGGLVIEEGALPHTSPMGKGEGISQEAKEVPDLFSESSEQSELADERRHQAGKNGSVNQRHDSGSRSGIKGSLIVLLVGLALGFIATRFFDDGKFEFSLLKQKSDASAALQMAPGEQANTPPVHFAALAPAEVAGTMPATAQMPLLALAVPAVDDWALNQAVVPPVSTDGAPVKTPVPPSPTTPDLVAIQAEVKIAPPLPSTASGALKSREETVGAAITLSSLAIRQYGDWNETTRDLISAANPRLSNLQNVPPGTKVLLPVITRDSLVVKDDQGKYLVYFASFEKPESAKMNLDAVKRNFNNAELFAAEQNGGRVSRLYIGPFTNKVDAQAVASSLWLKYLPLLN